MAGTPIFLMRPTTIWWSLRWQAGGAGIVTHNVRDLGRGELVFDQLRLLTPAPMSGEIAMTTLTIRLPDDTAERLKSLAR